MTHSWRDLLFLHWEVDVKILQSLIPKGLTVDTFDGKAYVGLVPFRITNIRASGLPPIPGFCHFPEINVRTYVLLNGQDPGVWFFSLDAANLSACIGARLFYKLPYFYAEISQTNIMVSDQCFTEYRSRRYLPKPIPAYASVDYDVDTSKSVPAQQDTLDHFLIERYLLYSTDAQQIYVGQVHHKPYSLSPATISNLREDLVLSAGIRRPTVEPIVHFAKGVEVEIFPILLAQQAR